MELTIRLSGDSLAALLASAEKVIPLAFAHASGASQPLPIPTHTTNECDEEGCTFVGSYKDDAGRVWLVYLCGLQFKCYLAP